MPLYRRGSKPFERYAVERRSLRFRRPGSSVALCSPKTKSNTPATARTSLDLELDLQAQHTRLEMLNNELDRLRELKQRLEVAKERGDTEVAAYLLEDENFQRLMADAESRAASKTPEERKVEKMLRKSPEAEGCQQTEDAASDGDRKGPSERTDVEDHRFSYVVDRELGVEV
nr:unnamed protein product [Callosobruchus chinensis]